MTPRGKLLIIGGAEDKGPIRIRPTIKLKNKEYVDFEILSKLIPQGTHENNRLEVITTASQEPLKTGSAYIRAFKKAGFKNVGHVNIDNKEELKNPFHLERIQKAHAVFFSGGDQFRLSTILLGSDLLACIKERYLNEENFILAGTSAGAMAMGDIMIYHADNNEAMLKGHVKITNGFNILPGCLVDTHFVKRGRFGRLAQAVSMNPGYLGIGLGEDTALLVENGDYMECLGSGSVIIIDGSDMRYCNINDAAENSPIGIENLRVHMLKRGNAFVLKSKKFLPKREGENLDHNELQETGKDSL
jgi:cyanophycinase